MFARHLTCHIYFYAHCRSIYKLVFNEDGDFDVHSLTEITTCKEELGVAS